MNQKNQNAAIEKIHESTLDNIMKAFDLVDPQEIQELTDYPPIAEKIAFGITRNFIENQDNIKQSVIIGGPCICYCQANIQKITLQDFIDILLPISFAAYMDLPTVIFFQTYEAYLQQKGIDFFQSSKSEWNRLFDDLKKIVFQISDHFNMSRDKIFIISTFDPDIKDHMDHLLNKEEIKNVLTPEFLYGMYSINNKSLHPKGSCDEDMFLDIYKRNLITYLPVLIDYIVQKDNSSVIVVENCTQLKTTLKAQQIHEKIFSNSPSKICHLAYISSPGLNGKEMYKCKKRNQISYQLTVSELKNQLASAVDFVKNYYESIFPGDEEATLLELFNI